MLFMDGMQKHHGFVQVQAVTSPHKNQCLEQPAIRWWICDVFTNMGDFGPTIGSRV